MAKKSLLGLDIGTKFVKCIEMTESRGTYRITGAGIRELPSAEGLADTVHALLTESRIKTRRVVSSISGRSVIVRYVSMPYMNDEEMQNALKYEAAKYIPFEVEDMILDYQRLKDEPVEGGEAAAEPAAKEMRILLAAAKRDFVNDHANQVEALGLVPTICDVDAFAIGNAYELSGSIRPDAFDWTKVAALVDIGATKTNVNIVKGDVSYFTREIYIGGDEMTDALTKKATLEPRQAEQLKREPRDQSAMVQETVASVLEDLCHEIHLSLDYFENQFDRPVDEIRISGGASLTTGLDDAFEKTFSRKPIHWNPVECLEIDGSRVDSQQVNDHACQFAVVVGLAARVRSG